MTEEPGREQRLRMTDSGGLLLTSNRLMFLPLDNKRKNSSSKIEGENVVTAQLSYMERIVEIPVGMIDKLSLKHTEDSARPCDVDGWLLEVQCTNAFSYVFYLGGHRDVNNKKDAAAGAPTANSFSNAPSGGGSGCTS